MKSNDENMKSIMAFQHFMDGRRVEEGQYPSLLMPWIYADVIYTGTDVKSKPISHAYFADFRTYFQDFVYDGSNDTLTITGEAYNNPNKKYKVILS